MAFHDRAECLSCAGDGELMMTGESGLEQATRIAKEIRGHFAYARRVLAFARVYAGEARAAGLNPRDDHRFIACLARVRDLRQAVAGARAEHWHRLASYERLAWCIACRGTGLANHECEGCGELVDACTANFDALENADILVHKGCDTGDSYFDRARREAAFDAFDPPSRDSELGSYHYAMGVRW